jgi:DNA-binding MltR family transcriptional regulator
MTPDTRETNPYRTNLDEYNWKDFFEEFQNETPRAAVIISAAFLEALLRDLIASFMIKDEKKVGELLGTENNPEGPISSFSARIKTAYCLGLISEAELNDLTLVRKIRNRFAHRLHGYSFESQEIIDWCNSLKTPKVFQEIIPLVVATHRDRYVFTVSSLVSNLGLRILSTQQKRRDKFEG